MFGLRFAIITGDASQAAGGAVGGVAAFVPNPRINAVMTVKQNSVYMYGGLYEAGDKQVCFTF